MKSSAAGKLLAVATMVERIVVTILMLLMLAVLILATFELTVVLFRELTDPGRGFVFLDVTELLELFSFFFLILIGIELLQTIRMYLEHDRIHAEVVLLVALIAVSRKVVVLDVKTLEPATVIGLAAVVLALSAGYVLIKRSHGALPRSASAAETRTADTQPS